MTSQFLGDLKLLRKEFLFVAMLNNMGGVLRSARVGELLIMRKPLAIHY